MYKFTKNYFVTFVSTFTCIELYITTKHSALFIGSYLLSPSTFLLVTKYYFCRRHAIMHQPDALQVHAFHVVASASHLYP